MKKYKINKEKLQKKLPLAIGLILIIIALVVFPNTLSRYASSGVSGTNINVAYSLLDVVQMENGTLVDSVKLPEVNPDGNYNDFRFQIRNYKDVEDEHGIVSTKIINTKMKYYAILTVTTNLPMTYYFNVETHDGKTYQSNPVTPINESTIHSCGDNSGDNISEGLYCDSHNTYFYKFTYPLTLEDSKLLTMTYGSTMADTVTLHYSLPESANTSAYQDIIELLSVQIHAEQYVKEN